MLWGSVERSSSSNSNTNGGGSCNTTSSSNADGAPRSSVPDERRPLPNGIVLRECTSTSSSGDAGDPSRGKRNRSNDGRGGRSNALPVGPMESRKPKAAGHPKERKKDLVAINKNVLHERGECVPCEEFARTRAELGRGRCANGDDCVFCHFQHGACPKKRPSMKDRLRYHKRFDQFKDYIAQAPDDFDPDTVVLPQSIENDPALKSRFLKRLVAFKESLVHEREEERVAHVGRAEFLAFGQAPDGVMEPGTSSASPAEPAPEEPIFWVRPVEPARFSL